MRLPPLTPARLARAALILPICVGLVTTAALALGLRAWVPWLAWATMIGAWWLLPAGPGGAAAPLSSTPGDADATAASRALRMALWIGLALAVVILLPACLRPWIRERADSWFHAAILAELQRHPLPPQDPYFAGFNLQYMWFYHTILYGLTAATGLGVFLVMPLLNALALIALVVAAAELALAVGLDARAATRAAWILPFGLGVLFWLFWPVRLARALTGVTSGADAVAQAFRLLPLDVGTTRMFLADFDSQPFFLNKFMVGTAYGLALALLLFYLQAVARFLAGRRTRSLAAAAAWLVPLLLLHPVVGLSALGVSALTAGALVLLGPARGGLGFGAALRWGAAALAALLVAAPYLALVMRGKPHTQLVPLGLDLAVLPGVLAGALFVLLAGGAALRRLARSARPEALLPGVWSAMMLLFAALVRLPGPNSADKFAFLVYLVPAVAAGDWVARRWPGRRGAWLLVLLLAPANLIGYAGYWGDADPRRPDADSAAAWAWLAERTPVNAVVVEGHERVEVPVRAGRRLFFGRTSYAEQWGYDPSVIAGRQAALAELYSDASPLDTRLVIPPLGRLSAPIYLILRRQDFTSAEAFHKLNLDPAAFERVFDRPTLSIYRLKG